MISSLLPISSCGSKLFPLRIDPIEKEGKNENCIAIVHIIQRPKLYGVFAVLSAIELTYCILVYLKSNKNFHFAIHERLLRGRHPTSFCKKLNPNDNFLLNKNIKISFHLSLDISPPGITKFMAIFLFSVVSDLN